MQGREKCKLDSAELGKHISGALPIADLQHQWNLSWEKSKQVSCTMLACNSAETQ